MNTSPITQKLKDAGFRDAPDVIGGYLSTGKLLSPETMEILNELADAEISVKKQIKLRNKLKKVSLPYLSARVEDIDFDGLREINKKVLKQLLFLDWLRFNRHLFLFGEKRCGKSWIASMLIIEAIKAGFTAKCIAFKELCNDLAEVIVKGELFEFRKELVKYNILMIDDLEPESLTPLLSQEIATLMGEVNGNGSLIITSQAPLSVFEQAIYQFHNGCDAVEEFVNRAIGFELMSPFADIYGREIPDEAESHANSGAIQ